MELTDFILQLLRGFAPFKDFFILLLGGLLIVNLYLLIRYQLEKKYYETTEYFKHTALPFKTVYNDTGRYGEYETFRILTKFDGYKRFLFNCYIPRNDTEITDTEIDLIMLHPTGIYVLESKNYSGWIYGNEKYRMWTQTLPTKDKNKQKNSFFNPTMQNALHIKWLSAFLEDETLPYHSFIVFSQRCELKKITLTTEHHHVIKRDALLDQIAQFAHRQETVFSNEQIDLLYEKLFPLTNADTEKVQLHIDQITNKHQ